MSRFPKYLPNGMPKNRAAKRELGELVLNLGRLGAWFYNTKDGTYLTWYVSKSIKKYEITPIRELYSGYLQFCIKQLVEAFETGDIDQALLEKGQDYIYAELTRRICKDA